MARIAFASYEIAPTTKGGAGVLIRNLADVLLREGHDVILILDLPPWEFEQFMTVDRYVLSYPDKCRAYHVGSVVDGHGGLEEGDFATHYEWRAYRFHLACQAVSELEHPDVVEFFDYGGVGHHALSAKVAGLAYQNTHLAVRLHTSLELMDRVSAEVAHDLEREAVFTLEHGALRLAETVLYPTPLYLNEAYLPYYEPWLGDVVESPPPIIDVPRRRRLVENPDVVLFYGRLSPLKGIDLFLDAALAILSEREAGDLMFYMVGFDPSFPDAPYRSGEELRRRIPGDLQDRFVFKGQWGRSRLERLLPRVEFAVFPTYIESFGYAAHELRHAGVPLVLSSIPAFRDAFTDGVDALFFDGSGGDLVRQMKRIHEDDALRAQMCNLMPPVIEPRVSFYGEGHESWINESVQASLPPVPVICVLVEGEGGLETTLGSIRDSRGPTPRVIVLRSIDGASDPGEMWFLGRRWKAEAEDGDALEPADLVTGDSLLVLRAGDQVDPWFLERSLGILGRQPDVGYVSSWKRTGSGTIDTFPADLMPEAIPVLGLRPLTRSLVRTEPGMRVDDLFDVRAGLLGEVHDLCGHAVGIMVPEVGLTVEDEGMRSPSGQEITFVVVSGRTKWQSERLARLLAAASLADDKILLSLDSSPSGAPPALRIVAGDLGARS